MTATIIKICEYCKVEYPLPDWKQSRNRKFCNSHCGGKANTERLYKNKARQKCAFCSNELEFAEGLGKRKYCDDTCKHSAAIARSHLSTDARMKMALEFVMEGKKVTELARSYGVPFSTVKKILANHGVPKDLRISKTNFKASKVGKTCEICGYSKFKSLQKAHIVPRRMGGPLELDNLLFLCPTHHYEFDHNLLEDIEIAKISEKVNGAYNKYGKPPR